MTAPVLNETEMGTWLFRVGIAVIGFLLALGVRDAKKSLDMVPALIAKLEGLEKALNGALHRIEELERERRK